MLMQAAQPSHNTVVTLSGDHLTINDLVRVARANTPVRLTDDPAIIQRVHASCDYVSAAIESGKVIYGIGTGFGGIADRRIPPEQAGDLQNNLLWFLKAGAGAYLPAADVRAAMLLRANALIRGVSGIRLELIQRFVTFLNAGVTPHVRELGSIGASGDLVPLASLAGALIGLDECFTVNFNGETMPAPSALQRLNLTPLNLRPKEGLALVNGTSVSTGMAANCVYDAQRLLALATAAHALALQGLLGTNQSFHRFIHEHKPHPGQQWAAAQMLELLDRSQLIRDELDGQHSRISDDLAQDRYSLRCLPQYMGPIVDGFAHIARQIAIEMNSANDNPLIDAEQQASYHNGNFLGQYVGIAMDQLRSYIGLLAKHLDVQIAHLVAPEFNRGLPASLSGNPGRKVNMGLKGLQIAGNSIMPLLTFLGNSLADRYPTHAEQFNQNINSQSFGAAYLARQSISLFQQYLAIALMFGVQSVDLRCHAQSGHYDARSLLSPATLPLYEAIRYVIERPPSAERPYIWNDNEQSLEEQIARIAADIAADGTILQAVRNLTESLQQHIPYRAPASSR